MKMSQLLRLKADLLQLKQVLEVQSNFRETETSGALKAIPGNETPFNWFSFTFNTWTVKSWPSGLLMTFTHFFLYLQLQEIWVDLLTNINGQPADKPAWLYWVIAWSIHLLFTCGQICNLVICDINDFMTSCNFFHFYKHFILWRTLERRLQTTLFLLEQVSSCRSFYALETHSIAEAIETSIHSLVRRVFAGGLIKHKLYSIPALKNTCAHIISMTEHSQ